MVDKQVTGIYDGFSVVKGKASSRGVLNLECFLRRSGLYIVCETSDVLPLL